MAVNFLTGYLVGAHLRVRFAFGANPRSDPSGWTWTDVTADVMQADGRVIDITVGRQDETTTAQPAAGAFTLDNRSGDYTMYSGKSQYYPNVRENTPCWVEVDPGDGTYRTRLFGFATAFQPAWDTTGNFAVTNVTAAGVTRRITQGKSPLRTPLVRAILGAAQTVTLRQYWPCEDQVQATQAATEISGSPPLSVSGTVTFAGMDWTQPTTGGITITPGTTFGTIAMPDLKAGGKLYAAFPAPTGITGWTVQAAIYIDPVTIDSTVSMFSWTEGGRTWEVKSNGISTDSVTLAVNGVTIATEPHIMINEDVRIDAIQSGADIHVSFKPMLAHTAQTATIVTSTLAGITQFQANPNGTVVAGDFSVGHPRIWDSNSAPDFKTLTQAVSAWNAYVGETPAARLTRLCTEQGEVFAVLDGSYTSIVTMGPQTADTFMNLARACELADAGMLYDGLSQGMRYRGLRDRYSPVAALTVNASTAQVQPPFAPLSDDFGRLNDVTMNRLNGGSARSVDKTGTLGTDNVGTYDTALTINNDSDAALSNRAAWERNRGTVQGFRYPTLNLDIRKIPTKAVAWAALRPLDVIEVTLPYSTQLPTGIIRLAADGYTEQLTNLQWTAQVNTSVQGVYDPAIYGTSASVGPDRYDASSSTVNTGFNTSAASIVIASATGTTPWTQTAAAFPFDILIAGEQMTVSAISSSTSPQTFTISARHVNGVTKSHLAGESVQLARTPTYGL